jgi:hypothetical protein
MKKIGLISKHLLELVVIEANRFLTESQDSDVVYFIQNQSLSDEVPAFGIMNIVEAYDFDGILIAFDLDSAEKIIRMPGASHRIYYITEAEWVNNGRTYDQLLNILRNPRLTFVTNTEDLKEIVEDCWQYKVSAVIPDYDVGAISATHKNVLSH